MPQLSRPLVWGVATVIFLNLNGIAKAQSNQMPMNSMEPNHNRHQSEQVTQGTTSVESFDEPLLPVGMTMQQALDYAASNPPRFYFDLVPDDAIYVYTIVEQLEYRPTRLNLTDQLGWQAQGWIGGDLNRFWWKQDGRMSIDRLRNGETQTDLLYSRLVSPLWNLQGGVRYANEWGGYRDLWSAVIAFQGLTPFLFEFDSSIYLSENLDLTADIEALYDLRITQRLVLQPRGYIQFSAQDIPEQELGIGLTNIEAGLRLRYEIKREFAPYLGVNYKKVIGKTGDYAAAAGKIRNEVSGLIGLMFVF